MNLSRVVKNVSNLLQKNQPQILLGFAVGGVVSTAYLTVKATWKAKEIIDDNEAVNGFSSDTVERFKERAKETWPLFVPAAVSGFGTVTCMVFASRGQAKRTAAAVAAYSFVEKSFSDYREKTIDQIGSSKEQKIRDAIVQDKINTNPPSKQIIFAGGGDVLFCDMWSSRYFKSDMETIRKAVNDTNAQLNHQIYVRLNDFYERIGLPDTKAGEALGWESDKLMELDFSTAMADDGATPCVTFDFNYVKSLWS